MKEQGIEPKQLNGEEVPSTQPDFNEYSWWIFDHFRKLSQSRGQGANGPCNLSYADLRNYQDVMQENLTRFECETIMAVDTAYIAEFYRQQEKNRPT